MNKLRKSPQISILALEVTWLRKRASPGAKLTSNSYSLSMTALLKAHL